MPSRRQVFAYVLWQKKDGTGRPFFMVLYGYSLLTLNFLVFAGYCEVVLAFTGVRDSA